MRKVRFFFIIFTFVLILSYTASSFAQAAKEITNDCTFWRNGQTSRSAEIKDHDYSTFGKLRRGEALEIVSEGNPIGGLYIQWYDRPSLVEIQVKTYDQWTTIASGGTHLSDWFPLPTGVDRCRISNVDKGQLFLAEITVYGEGDKPENVQQWTDLEKADLMVLVAHPDDELLWMGGLLPTYAGERKNKVQVVYLVRSTPLRRLELLDGLWHCGVTAYPDTLSMTDFYSNTLKKQYQGWRRETLMERLVSVLRRHQPEVLVTHDINGEYGHGAHRAAADISISAMNAAADPASYPASAASYGAWQVKKLYLHLWTQEGQRVTQMDWSKPLSAFQGKDSITIATEALEYHASQRQRKWEMTVGGEYDNALFGLYASTVGPDEHCDDLLEHILP
ncbi:MAG: PIG-L family deacetylase [Eubacteriales bacterium]|nr:PIG-L family deacetylase [Eubacteriales bacterium]